MIEGVINNIWTKDVKTKYGPKKVTLFSLDGNDEDKFNLAFGRTEVKIGDRVSFVVTEERYGEQQVDKETLKILERDVKTTKPAAEPTPSVPKNTKGYSRGTFPLDFNDGQRSIIRQHAFTQASEIVREGLRLEGGEISDDAQITEHIISIAYKIEKYTSGDDLREEMKDLDDDE